MVVTALDLFGDLTTRSQREGHLVPASTGRETVPLPSVKLEQTLASDPLESLVTRPPQFRFLGGTFYVSVKTDTISPRVVWRGSW